MLKAAIAFLVVSLVGAAQAQVQGSARATSSVTPEENLAKAVELIEKQNDFLSAMPLLRAAADAGNVQAQTKLAEFLDYGEENGEAEKYFTLAVAQGDPQAKLGLAIMHIARDAKDPDIRTARRLIEEAARQSYGPAVKALATAYAKGGLGIAGVELESEEALGWIRRGADLDDLVALEKLEEAYRTGRYGLPIDGPKADEFRARINKINGVTENQESSRRRRR